MGKDRKIGDDLVAVQIGCGVSSRGGKGWMSSGHTVEEELMGLAAELDLGRKRGIRDICLSIMFLFWGESY